MVVSRSDGSPRSWISFSRSAMMARNAQKSLSPCLTDCATKACFSGCNYPQAASRSVGVMHAAIGTGKNCRYGRRGLLNRFMPSSRPACE